MGRLSRLFGLERRADSLPVISSRDPGAATLFGTFANTFSGVAVTPELALACPAVRAPIRLISGAVSVFPMQLFRRTADDGRSPAADNLLYDLVHSRPNSWQTSAGFRRVMTERMLAYGNAYARIRNPGAPTALEPMHPNRVFPYRTSDGEVWYRHIPQRGAQIDLSSAEVLHIRYGPARDDEGLEAQSVLVVHRETVGLAMACTEYLSRFFANYATPKSALEVPSVLTRAAGEALRDSWEQKQAGLSNAHRIAILDGGMKLHALGMTNNDAQFLEIYKAVCSDIAERIYGVPAHLSGSADKTSSWGTGVEQMNIGYVQHVLQPVIEEWEQSLDASLLSSSSRRRYFFEMNVDGLMRGDFKSRMEGYGLQVQWGLVTPNEVRRMMNLAPLPGGDSRWQPLNMAPADKILDILLKPTPDATKALREILHPETANV
jgi:HK97 family phage portal protein